MAAWAYMLRCADSSFYVGCTTDLDQRVAQNRAGTFGGYTSTRLPIEVVWCEAFPFVHEAIEAERHLKGWSRAKKEALVMGDPTRLKALASRSRSPEKQHDRLHPTLRYPDPDEDLD